MPKNNFQRMMQVIGEVFDTRNDPEQLQVTEKDREKLQALHPATMSEYADENGPIVWVLVIPTTSKLMDDFISAKISEQALLDQTPLHAKYDSIYLCSATVLPEYRRKGLAKKLTLEAIRGIQKAHPVKYLFVWPFTGGGDHLADALARETGLELKKRTDHHK
jgi:ribosomal protein S18 acetylase RimI-like enzyme